MQIRRKPAQRKRPLPCFSWMLVAFLLLILICSWLFVPFFVLYSASNEQSFNLKIPFQPKEIPHKNSDHSVVRPGSDLLCSEVKHKIVEGEWIDPNEGKVWARETVTFPNFFISLHAQEYDPVRWRIMDEGKYYEDEVHGHFVSILEQAPRSFVLDVGANIGYYTLLSASLGHNVIAFEPNPANILRLCDSLKLNDFLDTSEIHIFQNAVSNVHGEVMMLHSPRNPGQAYIKPLQEGEEDEKVDIHKARTTVVTLDKVAEEQGWFDRPDFKIKVMKVDVEGKEPLVFLGSPKLLKSGIVENILTEGRRFGRANIRESFEVLFEAGYCVKEPIIPIDPKATPKAKASAVCDWYIESLGKNSQKVRDMWWVREG